MEVGAAVPLAADGAAAATDDRAHCLAGGPHPCGGRRSLRHAHLPRRLPVLPPTAACASQFLPAAQSHLGPFLYLSIVLVSLKPILQPVSQLDPALSRTVKDLRDTYSDCDPYLVLQSGCSGECRCLRNCPALLFLCGEFQGDCLLAHHIAKGARLGVLWDWRRCI